jgi:hypothetical protein
MRSFYALTASKKMPIFHPIDNQHIRDNKIRQLSASDTPAVHYRMPDDLVAVKMREILVKIRATSKKKTSFFVR